MTEKRQRPKKVDPRDDEALALWAAGVSFDLIASKLHFRNAEAAESAASRAIERHPDPDPAVVRRLELHRLNVMQMALWPKARRGDADAVSRIMEIQRQRLSLGDSSPYSCGSLLGAVEITISCAKKIEPLGIDAALCESARQIASHIDLTRDAGSAESRQKSLYLVPHLMNILREMHATPGARVVSAVRSRETGGENVSRLADFSKRSA